MENFVYTHIAPSAHLWSFLPAGILVAILFGVNFKLLTGKFGVFKANSQNALAGVFPDEEDERYRDHILDFWKNKCTRRLSYLSRGQVIVVLIVAYFTSFFCVQQIASIETMKINGYKSLSKIIGGEPVNTDKIYTSQAAEALLDSIIAEQTDRKDECIQQKAQFKAAKTIILVGSLGGFLLYVVFIVQFYLQQIRLKKHLTIIYLESFSKKIKNMLNMLRNGFLHSTFDPVGYYRTVVIDEQDRVRFEEDEKFTPMVNIGIIGTLVGLALAFYSAAANFPAEISKSFTVVDAQTAVASGLIQSIFNYSFAVMSSLVAYLVVGTMKPIRAALSSDFVEEFDKLINEVMIGSVESKCGVGDDLHAQIEDCRKRVLEVTMNKMKECCDELVKAIQRA
jgi:hypothetical protein